MITITIEIKDHPLGVTIDTNTNCVEETSAEKLAANSLHIALLEVYYKLGLGIIKEEKETPNDPQRAT